MLLVLFVGCDRADRSKASDASPKPTAPLASQPAVNTATSARVGFVPITVGLPEGWKEIKREPDRVTLRSADGSEQTTVSRLALATAPTFEEFKRICEIRLEGERRESNDQAMTVTGPSNEDNRFTLLFTGIDQSTKRLFSGRLFLVGTSVLTLYVEGVGVTPEQHLASFKAFVKGLGANGSAAPP